MRFFGAPPAILFMCLSTIALGAGPADPLDVIVSGGTILDGSGREGYVADIGVKDGRIVEIGDLVDKTAVIDIDATGLVVAPGFINIHDHPEPNAVFRAENVLLQGITTEIGNPDGAGETDIGAQADAMATNGLAANLGLYIGFNAVWAEIMGNRDVRPGTVEIEDMQNLVAAGLQAGAWGVSAGLDYKPAFYATEEEVVRVVSVATPWRTNFPSHPRVLPETGYSGLAAVKETTDIGTKNGLTAVLTHVKIQGHEQGRAGELLDLIDRQVADGHYTAADIYPYNYGFSNVASLLIPGWAMEGGQEELFARFKDPKLRQQISEEIERVIGSRWNGPKGVYVVGLERELTDLMDEWGVSVGEAIIRLNEQYGPRLPTYLRFGIEEDIIRILKHPNVAVSCDCGSLLTVTGHPRAFGTFPLVLGRYVREMGELSWEEAVRKMSGLPASIIGMTDRGFIAAGMQADITVFDPRTIAEQGTIIAPALPIGVRYVLVNGHLAVSEGKVTGVQGGRILKRARNMPSRPFDLSSPRRLVGSTVLDLGSAPIRLSLKLKQEAADRWASGHLVLRDQNGRKLFTSRNFGVMQTATDWASITGTGQWANGEAAAFSLIYDDVASSISVPTVELSINGHSGFRGAIGKIKLTHAP